jgi:hypothetical protein
MRRPEHFKLYHNNRLSLLPRAAMPFVFLLVLLMVSACTTIRDDQQKDGLYTQIYTDMMYGADDYFGQSTDLSYADGVVPTVVQPVFGSSQVVAAAPVTVVPPPVVVVPPVGGG